MLLYKLTDRYGKTRNDTQWGPNVSHSGTGEGALCGPGWIHAYEDPFLAVVMNPIHAAFDPETMLLWEAEGEIAIRDGQLKCGCKTLTTIRQIPVPVVSTNARVRFAILCALEVEKSSRFVSWAEKWLSGEDRSRTSAWAAWAAEATAAAALGEASAWAAGKASVQAAAREKNLDLISLLRKAIKEEESK